MDNEIQNQKSEAKDMRELRIEKVTLNVGVGEPGEKLENAKTLLGRISGKTPVTTLARERNPVFKIRRGMAIGTKVTVRGTAAKELLRKAIETVDNRISSRAFDSTGNFSFGVKEYIDFPGIKYDPKIGIIGFDVAVTLARRGMRVKLRKRARTNVPRKQKPNKEESMEFVKNNFKVEIV